MSKYMPYENAFTQHLEKITGIESQNECTDAGRKESARVKIIGHGRKREAGPYDIH